MSASEISRDESSGFSPTVSNELALRQSHQLTTALARQEEEKHADDSLTLTDIGRILLKHKWTLLMVIALHWEAFIALFGFAPASFGLALKPQPLPWLYVATMMGLTLLFEVLPYLEELVRGLRYAGAHHGRRERA